MGKTFGFLIFEREIESCLKLKRAGISGLREWLVASSARLLVGEAARNASWSTRRMERSCPRRESNPDLALRRGLHYPLCYEGLANYEF